MRTIKVLIPVLDSLDLVLSSTFKELNCVFLVLSPLLNIYKIERRLFNEIHLVFVWLPYFFTFTFEKKFLMVRLIVLFE